MSEKHKLTSLQLELLKIYSFEPSEEELLEIKRMLGTYYAQKLTHKVNQVVQERSLTQQDVDRWLDEENE